jgi:hypothetical protein
MLEKIVVAMHKLGVEPGFPTDGADFWVESSFFTRTPWRAADRCNVNWSRPWADAVPSQVFLHSFEGLLEQAHNWFQTCTCAKTSMMQACTCTTYYSADKRRKPEVHGEDLTCVRSWVLGTCTQF